MSDDRPLDFSHKTQKNRKTEEKINTLHAAANSNHPHSDLLENHTTGLYDIRLRGQQLVCLEMDGQKRLCLAQISSTLLQNYSYNEIHNRRVALGITCVQCSPSQLEQLREFGAMPASSRRCGTITLREAERLIKSFLDEPDYPKLPDNFIFDVQHHCGWGCKGQFVPARYNSSRAKCVRCSLCQIFLSPNKFIFHSHTPPLSEASNPPTEYRHPDAANFNAWRRHLFLGHTDAPMALMHAWEDVKAMFNGGNRKRNLMALQADLESSVEEYDNPSESGLNSELTRVDMSGRDSPGIVGNQRHSTETMDDVNSTSFQRKRTRCSTIREFHSIQHTVNSSCQNSTHAPTSSASMVPDFLCHQKLPDFGAGQKTLNPWVDPIIASSPYGPRFPQNRSVADLNRVIQYSGDMAHRNLPIDCPWSTRFVQQVFQSLPNRPGGMGQMNRLEPLLAYQHAMERLRHIYANRTMWFPLGVDSFSTTPVAPLVDSGVSVCGADNHENNNNNSPKVDSKSINQNKTEPTYLIKKLLV